MDRVGLLVDRVGLLMEARVADRLHHHRSPLVLGHAAHKSGPHRHLGTHQPPASATDSESAAQHVTLGDPQGAAFRAECCEHALEHPGQQLVEIEGGVELEADGMEQAQTFDFAAQLLHGGRRTADDVGHVTIMRLGLELRKG